MIQSTPRPARWALMISFGALLGACAAGPQGSLPPVPGPTQPAPGGGGGSTVDPVAPYESSGHAAMDAWRVSFASRAAAQGRDPAAIRAVLDGISPLEIYLSSDFQTASTGIADQAEFAKPIWEYLRTAVSNSRKMRGADKLVVNDGLFDQLETAYGVDRQVLTAIWGMETNFGSFMGTNDAANALANMAVEGRRRSFAEGELIALMKILERGEARRSDMTSGWAGAMGHTQFMPSTFLAHAQDFTGDGLKDVWDSEADALASAANYLSVSGYEPGEPWGLEVNLPEGFDYAVANGQDRRVSSWQSMGVSFARAGDGADSAKFAELWVPAGHRGPKFLLFKNFDVFKTYNRADSYALAVGLLSDGVLGKEGPLTAWPTDLRPLTIAQVKQLQAGLNELGHDAGPVDGIAGRGTKGALRRFQAANGFIADGFPTTEMLAYVLSASGS